MSPGPRPTATVLKIIRGESRSCRLRDDKPKINAMPRVPPGAVLSPEERAMWDELMETTAIPGVHGPSDGAAFVRVCRLWVRVNHAHEKCNKLGLVMRSPKGKPELQPYVRLWRDLEQQLGMALAEIGATPGGRAKIAGPRVTGARDDASWDAIN